MTVFAIVAAVTFFSSKAPVKPQPDDTSSPFQPVPTAAAPIASMDLSNDDQASGPTAPGPMPTAKPMDATFSPTSLVVTTFPTAILGQDEVIRVSRPQPVMEEGDAANMSTWHAVSDPTHGYTIAYPPNWWTQVTGDERYFFPWGPGGIAFAPYWLELRVMDNAQGYTPASYNKTQLGGRGTVNAPGQLRYRHTDEHNGYDEVYAFSTHGIYVLRLSVPHESTAGAYSKRWAEGEDIFSRMSGRLVLPSAGPTEK